MNSNIHEHDCVPPPPVSTNLPVGGGGVGAALQGPRGGGPLVLGDHQGHGGGGVGLGDGDLLGLARLLAAVRAEAVALQHRGARPVEAVRDAEVRLALHEGPLGREQREVHGQNFMETFHKVLTMKVVGG